MFSGDVVGIVLLAALAFVVALWGLWPLWSRPIDPASSSPLPPAAIAGRPLRERPTRRVLTRCERRRVVVAVVVILLALGAGAAIVWLDHVFQDLGSGLHE